eukprot:jgi/Galph1/5354/GphlegSOOS_G3949.1
MDELERALFYSLNPTTAQNKKLEAIETFEKIRQADNVWQICLEKLRFSNKDEVRFWCIQTLCDLVMSTKWDHLSAQEKVYVRDSLTCLYFGVSLNRNGPTTTVEDKQPTSPNILFQYLDLNAAIFVKNKLAQLLASLVAREYPHQWPQVFRGLLSSLPDWKDGQHPSVDQVELFHRFLRFLYSLDEEFLSLAAIQQKGEIGTRVRDGLRMDCLEQIVHRILQLVEFYEKYPLEILQENCCLVLDICRRFIEWMDISLITATTFMTPILRIITQSEHCGKPIAIRIFTEMVMKKMTAEKKWHLLRLLNLVEFLHQQKEKVSRPLQQSNSFFVDFVQPLGYLSVESEFAKFVNAVAMETLNLVKETQKSTLAFLDITEAMELLYNCLPLLTHFLFKEAAVEEENSSEHAWIFLMNYVNTCKKIPQDFGNGISFILSAVSEQIMLSDERLSSYDKFYHFQEQRNKLLTLFKNSSRIYPNLTVETIQHRLWKVHEKTNWTKETLMEIECVYVLSNAMMELNCKSLNQCSELILRILSSPPKMEWFAFLLTEEQLAISTQPVLMEQLMISFHDLLSHCTPSLASDVSILSSVLVSLMDERGLRNNYSIAIRNKAATSLSKIARPLRQVLATHFFDFMLENIEYIVFQTSLPSTEANPTVILVLERCDFLGYAEKLCLIELVGLLLGTRWDLGKDITTCQTYLLRWLNTFMSTIEHYITTQNVSGGCAVIEALTCVAKGFTKDQKAIHERNGKIDVEENDGLSMEQEGEMNIFDSQSLGSQDLRNTLLDIWKPYFPIILQFQQMLSNVCIVKSRCLVFYHRMVETLGEDMLPWIKSSCLDIMTQETTAEDLMELLLLINQILVRLKKHCQMFLLSILTLLFQRLHYYYQWSHTQMYSAVSSHGSEVWREDQNLWKTFYVFLHHLTSQDMEDILFLPEQHAFLLFCLERLKEAITLDAYSTEESYWTNAKNAWIVVRKLVLFSAAAHATFEGSGGSVREWIMKTFVYQSLLSFIRAHWSRSNKIHLSVLEPILEFYQSGTINFFHDGWEPFLQQLARETEDSIPQDIIEPLVYVLSQRDKQALRGFFLARFYRE